MLVPFLRDSCTSFLPDGLGVVLDVGGVEADAVRLRRREVVLQGHRNYQVAHDGHSLRLVLATRLELDLSTGIVLRFLRRVGPLWCPRIALEVAINATRDK